MRPATSTHWRWLIVAIVLGLMPFAAVQAQQVPPATATTLAELKVDKLPAGPLAWVVDEVRTTKPVTHQHDLGFVYAESPRARLTIGDHTTTLAPGMGAAISAEVHIHSAGTYLELRLAAPDSAPLANAKRIFATEALPGLPTGPALLRFVHVVVPANGGRVNIHTHPGPELIYDGIGSLVLQTASHGNETLHVGDVRVVPPDTAMQLRNESGAESGFLALLVADASRPFLSPASFEPVPVARPAIAQPAAPAPAAAMQPTGPAQLPKTGETVDRSGMAFAMSLLLLLIGLALGLWSRKRNIRP